MTFYISQKVIISAIALGALLIGASYLNAWTLPGANPPNNNVLPPINTGSGLQMKNGPLGVNTLAVYGASDFSGAMTVNSQVSAQSFLYTSDARLKENIDTVEGLELVNQLHGVRFNWAKDGRADIGLLAQEVEQIAPELVHTDETTGYKSVAYGNVVAILIEAIKAQQLEIEALQAQVGE